MHACADERNPPDLLQTLKEAICRARVVGDPEKLCDDNEIPLVNGDTVVNRSEHLQMRLIAKMVTN